MCVAHSLEGVNCMLLHYDTCGTYHEIGEIVVSPLPVRKSNAVAAEDAALLETIENSSDTNSQNKPAHEIENERINVHIAPSNAAVDGLVVAPARAMATIEAEQPAAPHIRSGRRPTLSTITRPGRVCAGCKHVTRWGR